MKLLVVDYLSIAGHRTFNRIHIEALRKIGVNLHLVGREGHFSNVEGLSDVEISVIPERFYRRRPIVQLTARLSDISCLRWIKRHFSFEHYDAVLFLTYDILSFFSFRTRQKVLLFDHNNVGQLDQRVKLILTRMLPHNFIHLALNDDMEQRLKELLPNRIVYKIPHGVASPSPILTRPSFMNEEQKFVLCPINANYDSQFLKAILTNARLRSYLTLHNLKLYVKKCIGVTSSDCILPIENRLEMSEYNYMIEKALAIMIPYSETFKYRCSGIFFECVARNKPVIATPIKAFTEYLDCTNIHLFHDLDTLIQSIEQIRTNQYIPKCHSTFNPEKYWTLVLDSLSRT